MNLLICQVDMFLSCFCVASYMYHVLYVWSSPVSSVEKSINPQIFHELFVLCCIALPLELLRNIYEYLTHVCVHVRIHNCIPGQSCAIETFPQMQGTQLKILATLYFCHVLESVFLILYMAAIYIGHAIVVSLLFLTLYCKIMHVLYHLYHV